jgi:hypothetical protein
MASLQFDFEAEMDLVMDEFKVLAAAALLEIAKKNAASSFGKDSTGAFVKTLYPVVIRLGSSITFEIRSDSKKPEAIWISEGTGPHPISAVNRNALAWQDMAGGSLVFAKSVMHPGTKANDWELKTVAEATPVLMDLLNTVVGKHF